MDETKTVSKVKGTTPRTHNQLFLVYDVLVMVIEELMGLYGFPIAKLSWDWSGEDWRALLSLRLVSRCFDMAAKPLLFQILTLSNHVQLQVKQFGAISPKLSELAMSNVRILNVTPLSIQHTPGLTEIILSSKHLKHLRFSWPSKDDSLQEITKILATFVRYNVHATKIEINLYHSECQMIAYKRTLKPASGRRNKDRLCYARSEANMTKHKTEAERQKTVMEHIFLDVDLISLQDVFERNDPAGFTILRDIPPFTSLSMSSSTFRGTAAYPNNSLQKFCNLSELKVLKLHEESISEFCRLVDLNDLPKLQHLRLSKCHYNGNATDPLIEMESLYTLLEHMTDQAGLKSLEIVGHPKHLFSFSVVPQLADFTQCLTHLELRDVPELYIDNPMVMTWRGDFYMIGEYCPNLNSFSCNVRLQKNMDLPKYVDILTGRKFSNLQYLHLGFTQSLKYMTELGTGNPVLDEDPDYDSATALLEQMFCTKSADFSPFTEILLTLHYREGRQPNLWETSDPNGVALSAETWTGSRAWKGTRDVVHVGLIVEGDSRWKALDGWGDWFMTN